jgi:hypothetical protein
MLMHSDLQNLLKILVPSALKARSDQHSHANIDEAGTKTGLQRVTITDLPNDTLVFQIDASRGRAGLMSPLFQASTFGHNKACDAFIIQRTDSGWICHFIDLKSNNPSGYSAQFKSTRCFWLYLKELLESFGSCQKMDVSENYLVINTARSSKRKTSPNLGKSPDSPRLLRVENKANIHFNALITN